MGRRFEFRLQPLLEARKRIEQEKQRNFAVLCCSLHECCAQIDRLAEQRAACMSGLHAAAMAGETPGLRARDRHVRYLHAAMTAADSRRVEIQAACDRARDELAIVNRDRRAMEELKARRRRTFEAEVKRCDELELDETNARRRERALRQRDGV